MADMERPITHDYKSQANVRVDFHDTSEGSFAGEGNLGKKYWQLFGFLTDEGLELSLTNTFKNALDFPLLEAARSMAAGVKGLVASLTGTDTPGYIQGGVGGNIILNAPYYWQGTSPINFAVSLYQIADKEGDIIENYQRIMEILSPGLSGDKLVDADDVKNISIAGSGPGLVYVHYFPEKGTGQGRIIFGPCLCEKVSMKVAPPYNSQYMPIIGAYTFNLLVSRIVDRNQIADIFGKSFKNSADYGKEIGPAGIK